MRHSLLACLFLFATAPWSAKADSAGPADLPGWEDARWGMTAAELWAAFGDRLSELPGRWVYGGAYARLAILDAGLGDLAFTAYFQMNDVDDRLQQVLLERRQQAAGPGSFAVLQEELQRRYGPPAQACLISAQDPTGLELIWRFPSTTVHATFLNFFSTSLLYFDPGLDIDPRRPQSDERIVRRRTLPRRITLRFHAAEREDLMSPRALCRDSLEDLLGSAHAPRSERGRLRP